MKINDHARYTLGVLEQHKPKESADFDFMLSTIGRYFEPKEFDQDIEFFFPNASPRFHQAVADLKVLCQKTGLSPLDLKHRALNETLKVSSYEGPLQTDDQGHRMLELADQIKTLSDQGQAQPDTLLSALATEIVQYLNTPISKLTASESKSDDSIQQSAHPATMWEAIRAKVGGEPLPNSAHMALERLQSIGIDFTQGQQLDRHYPSTDMRLPQLIAKGPAGGAIIQLLKESRFSVSLSPLVGSVQLAVPGQPEAPIIMRTTPKDAQGAIRMWQPAHRYGGTTKNEPDVIHRLLLDFIGWPHAAASFAPKLGFADMEAFSTVVKSRRPQDYITELVSQAAVPNFCATNNEYAWVPKPQSEPTSYPLQKVLAALSKLRELGLVVVEPNAWRKLPKGKIIDKWGVMTPQEYQDLYGKGHAHNLLGYSSDSEVSVLFEEAMRALSETYQLQFNEQSGQWESDPSLEER